MEPLYTICFAIDNGRILMLRRNKRPYPGHWTGLGGKIEPGETPDTSVLREMQEESGYTGLRAEWFSYRGVACWLVTHDAGFKFGAMYVYVAVLPGMAGEAEWETREGLISWKPMEWVLASENTEVAPHVARLLPVLLESDWPQLYAMRFCNRAFVGMDVVPWQRGELTAVAG